MPIRRSTVSLGHAQADGCVYVRERHEWDGGAPFQARASGDDAKSTPTITAR